MTDEYRAGAVWWLVMDFQRGRGDEDKFIVLLSDWDSGESGVAVFATSQAKWYPRVALAVPPCGCPVESCYRIDPKQVRCFTRTTFVEFGNPYPFNRKGLEDSAREGKAEFKLRIVGDRLRAILKCAILSGDIDGDDMDLIKAALAAHPPTTSTKATKPPPSKGTHLPSMPVTSIVAVNAWWDAFCAVCRVDVFALTGWSPGELKSIAAGSRNPTDAFLADADAAFKMVRESPSAGCTCSTKTG